MKQLTDSERLEVALLLLTEHEDINEYNRLCEEREHQPERNGFYNTPAECENFECKDCDISDYTRKHVLDCPYMN